MATVYDFLNADSSEVEEQRVIRAPGATAGDVLTVQANGTIDPAPGGSLPGTVVPVADSAIATVEDYADPWGGPRQIAVLVTSEDASAVALAVEGDDFPRFLLTAGGEIFFGDGSIDPTSGVELFYNGGLLSAIPGISPAPAASPLAAPQLVQLSPRFSITSGAIPSTAVSSGVGLQPSPNADVEVVTSVVFGGGGGGCVVEISPDNITYTAVALPSGSDVTQMLSVRVPGAWYVKFTTGGAATLAANVFIY